MNAMVIQVDNISKLYRLGVIGTGTLAHDLNRWWCTFLGKSDPTLLVDQARQNADGISVNTNNTNSIWALKDISFEVRQGEVLGIIGSNGAGKSTLLKILSRVTAPTTGECRIKGRIASLLEVGTGFHPELTGRENIYLNGAILGLTRAEIRKKFNEIVAFSEVERYIDTPVKRYSSGMYVRLAFAVAAHLEPEILIVDEVLAVGDTAFQQKCLWKMGDVAKEGRTVLFVSHNMAAIENLCNCGIVLNKGKITFQGTQEEAINHYLSINNTNSTELKDRTGNIGSGEIRVMSIEIRDNKGNMIDSCKSGQDISISLNYETRQKSRFSNILVGISFKTQLGVPVFLHHNRLTKNDFGVIEKDGCFICNIHKLPLPAGNYILGYSIMPDYGRGGTYYDSLAQAAKVSVVEGDFYGSGEIPPLSHGVSLINASWSIKTDPVK